jgi:hypothetical protein
MTDVMTADIIPHMITIIATRGITQRICMHIIQHIHIHNIQRIRILATIAMGVILHTHIRHTHTQIIITAITGTIRCTDN